MVKSGANVPPECIEEYNNFKFKKSYDFIIYRLTPDLASITIAHAPPKKSFQEVKEFQRETNDICGESAPALYKFFFEKLTEGGNCGYGIMEMKWIKKGLGLQSDLIMISWVPETSKIKQKMLYSSSKDDLKRKLEGIEKNCYEFTDLKDFEYKELMDRISKGAWDPSAPLPEA